MMLFTKYISLYFIFSLLCSCSGPYLGKEVFGADEFVLDSYKIRSGKLSILEMEGKCIEEFEALEKVLISEPRR